MNDVTARVADPSAVWRVIHGFSSYFVVVAAVQPGIFDALSTGAPVITADTEAARELLVDGESALLVPPDDPHALAAAVARLAADDELRVRIAAGGNRVFHERASRRALAARWAELLAPLV